MGFPESRECPQAALWTPGPARTPSPTLRTPSRIYGEKVRTRPDPRLGHPPATGGESSNMAWEGQVGGSARGSPHPKPAFRPIWGSSARPCPYAVLGKGARWPTIRLECPPTRPGKLAKACVVGVPPPGPAAPTQSRFTASDNLQSHFTARQAPEAGFTACRPSQSHFTAWGPPEGDFTGCGPPQSH
jgi:hypothetical protein